MTRAPGPPVIVLFTRDLRVHDNPALAAAASRGRQVIPLFVWDEALLARSAARANRLSFLRHSVLDLDRSLRDRGGALIVRKGDPVEVVAELVGAFGVHDVHVAADLSGLARRRERRLERRMEQLGGRLRLFPPNAVVPPGEVRPGGGDHYKVFTPYLRAWWARPWRPVVPAPAAVNLPPSLEATADPSRTAPPLASLTVHLPSPNLQQGGEDPGRARMAWWLSGPIGRYEDTRDLPAIDGTSRLSAYLHFGCLSVLELAVRARALAGTEPFVRQLAWRDFFGQVLAARPDTVVHDYRPGRRSWSRDPLVFDEWAAGTTGYALVDAGMRQLVEEGWVHNRVRMVAASFLTKQLGIDWRLGAEHFDRWLADGDAASNIGNWQWAAGVGNDTRPNRVLNPLRQARRFDPAGDYVRRFGVTG